MSEKLPLTQEPALGARVGLRGAEGGPSARSRLAKGPGDRDEAPLPSSRPTAHRLPRLTPSPRGCCLTPRVSDYGDYFAFM